MRGKGGGRDGGGKRTLFPQKMENFHMLDFSIV
jgi:hypothetical protein